MSRVLRLFGSIVVIAMIAGILAGIFTWREMERVMNAPLNISAPNLFTIESGATLSSIARDMEAQGWIAHYG